jgi:hypothetical protein
LLLRVKSGEHLIRKVRLINFQEKHPIASLGSTPSSIEKDVV